MELESQFSTSLDHPDNVQQNKALDATHDRCERSIRVELGEENALVVDEKQV